MSAIVGVLNESLTEAIKSFYKARKAYITLESILAAETKFLRERSSTSVDRPVSKHSTATGPNSSKSSIASPTSMTSLGAQSKGQGSGTLKENVKQQNNNDDDEDAFFDVDENHAGAETPLEYAGHLSVAEGNQTGSSTPNSQDPEFEFIDDFSKLTLSETVKTGEDISLYGDHPIDVFIISGSNFCFGVLNLLVSLVPPSFATLLKIVGFKGDRERGIQMLWQATKFHNIHGALAGLVLFGYYNGITGFCDIIPQRGQGSHPKERCRALLADMRERYPKSHLWLLEEARMLASDKKLDQAVSFMKGIEGCPLKQLEALQWFELSLNSMFLHDFEGTSAAFQKCVTLNNWSHGLYYYICGASHLELYRKNKAKDPKEAAKQAELASNFFKKVPENTGKKRFLARQLPFDVFINRKIEKWEARATEWKCEFVDAIGVSPLEEMNYFWNGYKRMPDEQLEVSLISLAWSESSENHHWEKEGLDEKAILSLLRAATLRNLRKTEEAKEILETEIICHDRSLFKGHLKDSWTAPCARYEMAANMWREVDKDARPEIHVESLKKCYEWLDEVARWESYDLEARYVISLICILRNANSIYRIGLKVSTGKSTLRRYGVEG